MKNPLRRKLRAVSAAIAEDALYVLTGLGLVYVPFAALLVTAFAVMALCGEPILAESWLLTGGLVCRAGAALCSWRRLRNRRRHWAALLFITVLSSLCGAWLLPLADEPVEHSWRCCFSIRLRCYPFTGCTAFCPHRADADPPAASGRLFAVRHDWRNIVLR